MKKIKLESVFNEFTLMGIAVSGAFYLGEYWEGIAVILFYLIGEWFQHKAVHKARSNIKALLDVRPETATVVYNNTYKIIKKLNHKKIGYIILSILLILITFFL